MSNNHSCAALNAIRNAASNSAARIAARNAAPIAARGESQSRSSRARARAAFTLYELLMVVTILAILSTLAFSKYGQVQKTSALKLSIANQTMVSRAVGTYLGLNDGEGLDRLDALINLGAPTGGAGGAFDFGAADIYRGPATPSERNTGLDPALASLLCAYTLAPPEALALRRLGLHYVMRSITAAPPPGTLGEDGSLVLAADEFDPAAAACVATLVTNGLACAAIDPRFLAGALVYQACGQNLAFTQSDAAAQNISSDSSAAIAALDAIGGKLLAFGLGQSASIIGKNNGGLETLPTSEVPSRSQYRNYILLIRLAPAAAPGMVRAEFAGVLDPLGNTVQAARQAL